MEITNQKEIEAELAKQAGEYLEKAVHKLVYQIVDELPKGHGSSIADEIVVKKVQSGGEGVYSFEVWASNTWVWLNDGTGIYNPKHAGMGPGGRIVPVYGAKALHFRNGALAAALGFEGIDVFLKSVKGITPRFYWDRYFQQGRIQEIMSAVAKA